MKQNPTANDVEWAEGERGMNKQEKGWTGNRDSPRMSFHYFSRNAANWQKWVAYMTITVIITIWATTVHDQYL